VWRAAAFTFRAPASGSKTTFCSVCVRVCRLASSTHIAHRVGQKASPLLRANGLLNRDFSIATLVHLKRHKLRVNDVDQIGSTGTARREIISLRFFRFLIFVYLSARERQVDVYVTVSKKNPSRSDFGRRQMPRLII